MYQMKNFFDHFIYTVGCLSMKENNSLVYEIWNFKHDIVFATKYRRKAIYRIYQV